MANALQDNLRVVLSRAVEEAARSAGNTSRPKPPAWTKGTKGSSITRSVARSVLPGRKGSSNAPFSGMSGVLVGAGAAALAPVAVKGAAKLAKGAAMNGLSNIATGPAKAVGKVATGPAKAVEKVGSGVSGAVGDKLSQKIDEAGGPSGILKDAAKSAFPFGGGDDDDDKAGDKGGAPGAGKGRRMPIQQSIDIGLPLETVYNQWTQFEEWPNFMHRVTRVTQEDDATVSFVTKIWGKSKKFKAGIETQQPDERIKWSVSEGIEHTGVVTFHELGPNLTRVMLSFDVDPGGMIEKLARGARHIKRAARGDMHRFKAFIEMQGQESGAWRGVIEDGEVVEQHDSSYDEGREYFDSDAGGAGKSKSRSGSRSGGQRSTRSRASSSGQRSTRSRASSSGSGGSSSRKSSSRSQGSSSRSQGSRARSQGSSRSQSSSSRSQRSSSRGQGSGTTRARSSSRSSSSRNGSEASPRSRSSRGGSGRSGGSNASGRSGGSAGRSRSATRSRTQASRSNGRS